ncbi:hypothetical protein lerEdw1_011201 [Lerista edwardsae]|nr:hypothetical protein lerEdw1_011201 [Lerista edwardsae]
MSMRQGPLQEWTLGPLVVKEEPLDFVEEEEEISKGHGERFRDTQQSINGEVAVPDDWNGTQLTMKNFLLGGNDPVETFRAGLLPRETKGILQVKPERPEEIRESNREHRTEPRTGCQESGELREDLGASCSDPTPVDTEGGQASFSLCGRWYHPKSGLVFEHSGEEHSEGFPWGEQGPLQEWTLGPLVVKEEPLDFVEEEEEEISKGHAERFRFTQQSINGEVAVPGGSFCPQLSLVTYPVKKEEPFLPDPVQGLRPPGQDSDDWNGTQLKMKNFLLGGNDPVETFRAGLLPRETKGILQVKPERPEEIPIPPQWIQREDRPHFPSVAGGTIPSQDLFLSTVEKSTVKASHGGNRNTSRFVQQDFLANKTVKTIATLNCVLIGGGTCNNFRPDPIWGGGADLEAYLEGKGTIWAQNGSLKPLQGLFPSLRCLGDPKDGLLDHPCSTHLQWTTPQGCRKAFPGSLRLEVVVPVILNMVHLSVPKRVWQKNG